MTKKMKEFNKKTIPELDKLIIDKINALREFRFGSSGSKTKNVKLGRTLRKDIARIMTEMRIRKDLQKVK